MVTLHLSCSQERKTGAGRLLAQFGYKPSFLESWTLCQSNEPLALFLIGLYAGRGTLYSGWITKEFLKKRRPVILVHGDSKSNEKIARFSLPLEHVQTGELQIFTWQEYENALAGKRNCLIKLEQALRYALELAEEVHST